MSSVNLVNISGEACSAKASAADVHLMTNIDIFEVQKHNSLGRAQYLLADSTAVVALAAGSARGGGPAHTAGQLFAHAATRRRLQLPVAGRGLRRQREQRGCGH
eukprot:3739396-Pleurochrysis_carterae.AAC.1